MPTSKIGLHDLDPSLFETLSNISGSNSQTKIFPLQVVASEDNQTVFPIGLDTFDAETDFAFVQSGVTNLFYGADFTIENKNIILKEGVPAGRTVGIYVLKNVESTDIETYIQGTQITPGSIPLDRLAEEIPTPTAESLGAVKETELPTKIKSLLTGGEISMVKSIQRGVIGFNKGASSTATINEVDMAKTVVLFGGCSGDSEYFSGATAHVTLENSTTVKVTREGNYANTYNWVEVAYTVLEFY